MNRILPIILLAFIANTHAGSWSNDSLDLKIEQIQSDQSHGYNPVITFSSNIGAGCQHDIYGQISKDIPEYKDMLSIAMMAMASGKEVRVFHDGCVPKGYVKVVGVNVKI